MDLRGNESVVILTKKANSESAFRVNHALLKTATLLHLEGLVKEGINLAIVCLLFFDFKPQFVTKEPAFLYSVSLDKFWCLTHVCS